MTTALADWTPGEGFLVFWVLLWAFAVMIIWAIPWYLIFQKAGEKGWKAFVPVYNYLVVLKIAGRPWWWIFLYFVPILNIVILVTVVHDVSRSFGHGVGFTLGLLFLSVLFWYILGFNDDRYLGPAGAGAATAPTASA